MSLYNLINGVTQATFYILPMLGKHPDQYPRFRDCFTADPDYPQYDNHIHVYTRTGGGNREEYELEIEEMRLLPGYVTDHDDGFDSTYATFVFRVPDEWRSDFEAIQSHRMADVSERYRQRMREVFPKLVDTFAELFAQATEANK